MDDIKNLIIDVFHEALEVSNAKMKVDLNDDTVLLESGLDSLGFAILVAKLEERLGYDPFAIMEEPVYPTTFSEFVKIYEKHQKK